MQLVKDKLRIAHIVDYLMPQFGYQEFLLPKWNQRHGHEVHIVTSDRYMPVSSYDETWGRLLGARILSPGTSVVEGLYVHRLPVAFELKARPYLRKLAQTISTVRPDVLFVHGTGAWTPFLAARLARRFGLPMLVDNHMVFSVRNRGLGGRLFYPLLRFLSPRLLGKATYKFLGVAEECCEFLAEEEGIDRSAIECLPLGVDTDLFQPAGGARAAARHRFGLPEKATVILQTGKLVPEKSPHLLAEAVAPLLRDDPQLHLAFAGGGSEKYLSRVRAPIESIGVTGQMHFIPLVPATELAKVYSVADIAVYPAGTSLSCLEASACGLPVIMTDLPASRWRAERGVGACYRDGDVEDLRRTIERLVRDEGLRRDIGRRSRAAVLRYFSYDAVARRAEELMHEAIAAKQRKARAPGGLGYRTLDVSGSRRPIECE